jgi:hypothetical protein
MLGYKGFCKLNSLCCNVTNMVLFLTTFKNILMFDIKTLMSFYEKKKKKEINFKSIFMVLLLGFNKDFRDNCINGPWGYIGLNYESLSMVI